MRGLQDTLQLQTVLAFVLLAQALAEVSYLSTSEEPVNLCISDEWHRQKSHCMDMNRVYLYKMSCRLSVVTAKHAN